MTEKQVNIVLKEYKEVIENKLQEYISKVKGNNLSVAEAMEYSLMIGGKRLRPVLVLEFCKACGSPADKALPFACALEMIHTYSLIHDDLPCMDNDDLRRGKPSCHIAFGEADALLAGDGLLNLAFETASGRFGDVDVETDSQIKAIAYLSKCSGISGMIGGQNLDLQNENNEKEPTLEELLRINSLKTSALIRCACVLGVIAGGGDESQLKSAEQFGENIGLAFQIVDDILDNTGDEQVLGKRVGSDSDNGKATFPVLLGLDKCRDYVDNLTKEAKATLSVFDNSEFLAGLADLLVKRDR